MQDNYWIYKLHGNKEKRKFKLKLNRIYRENLLKNKTDF